MNHLFIELYLDEDVDVLVADLLRARGFKSTTTQEAGQLGKGDDEQLVYAVTQHKTFFTHNRNDFERIAEEYFATRKEHNGIIIGVRRQPYEIARRLLTILNNVTADEIKNQLRYM
ncbi:MAG TPA: DUF5615 family PIN-like protein [Blastocatellia bacterium]|nr:DUF5615 family PIN-like protein [Blastocatellia bacterium]